MTYILGAMSGSSLDGLDLAICSFTDQSIFTIHNSTTIELPLDLRTKLKNFSTLNAFQIADLDAYFALFSAHSIRDFTNNWIGGISLVVSHGHTLYHNPANAVSWQIGNGGIIAAVTGIDTLCDLRVQDVALGGQGAPLAALVDLNLFKDYTGLLNLGGIANITINQSNTVYSWDISPCNQVFNHLAQKEGKEFDKGGSIARSGKILMELIHKWQENTYFSQMPPKSMDNTWVKENYIKEIDKIDQPVKILMASFAEFVAIQLSKDLKSLDLNPGKILVTGGGAFNAHFISRLKVHLSPLNWVVEVAEESLINYKEAMLMAYMGHRYINKKTNTISTATGAEKDLISGALYLGNGKR
jgi:anhydro-N-acetylmuramic acid kinase